MKVRGQHLILSIHLVPSTDCIQIISLYKTCLYFLSHVSGLRYIFLYQKSFSYFSFHGPSGRLVDGNGFVSYCATWNICASYFRLLLLVIVWCCVSVPMV